MTAGRRERPTDEDTSTAPDERVRRFGLEHGTEVPDDGLVIPRLDKTALHEDFATDNVGLRAVMITIEAARIYVEQGETAGSVFGDGVVVGVSTAIPDEQLEWWYPEREVDVIRRFCPDFYLPCDRPVYERHSPARRRDIIRRYLGDIREVAQALQDQPVVIVPFVKGITSTERARCYRAFEDLGFDRWAYYCAQYFLYGHRGEELVGDVRSIAQEGSPDYMMLVGLLSERYLTRMPPTVYAAAGQSQWISQSDLRNERLTMNQKQSNFTEWAQYIEELLGGGQTALGQWATQPGDVYGD